MCGQKGKVHLGPNVSSFAHDHGCMVIGSGAMAAYEYYYYYLKTMDILFFFKFQIKLMSTSKFISVLIKKVHINPSRGHLLVKCFEELSSFEVV